MGTGGLLLAGSLVGGAVADRMQQSPKMPNLPAPPPPPQPAQMPNVQGLVAGMGGTGQAGGAKGAGQTFLAGSGGVDPNSLALNKPTLLGQ